MADVILNIRNLNKTYDQDTHALKNVDMDVTAGEFVSVIGPSGAGKSTLFRCINRMVDPDEDSEVNFENKNIATLPKKELRKVRRHIGMVFQHYNLVYRLTALENVLHGRLGYYSTLKGVLSMYSEEDIKKAAELLKMLGLEKRMYFRCKKLSGGQKQRVGIARALIQHPSIMLCDEPIASLDPQSSKVIMEYLKMVNRDFNIPCLVNLHQVDVAKKYSDRIIGMRDGEVVFEGTPEELTDEMISNIYGAKIDEILA